MSLQQAYKNVKNNDASINDLISVICGRYKKNVCIESAYELSKYGLHGLMAKGFTPGEARKILAAFSLIEMASYEESKPEVIRSKEDAYAWLKEMAFKEQEHFVAIALDKENRVLDFQTLFIGNAWSAVVGTHEICRFAIQNNAHSILISHTHPSHICSPSDVDLLTTNKTAQALELIQVELLDHVIVGGPNFLSLREKGYL